MLTPHTRTRPLDQHDLKGTAERMLPFRETTYGIVKRARFVLDILDRRQATQREPLTVLDFGCGTGEFVTLPIAAHGFTVTGLDIDPTSIHHAEHRRRRLGLSNVRFICATIDEFLARHTEAFDAAICSEVLEHVPDPVETLRSVGKALKDRGLLVVTVPNGRGPYEIQMRVWAVLNRIRVIPTARAIRNWLIGRARDLVHEPVDTLARDCPHVHFYTARDVRDILSDAQFRLVSFHHRSFLCGPFIDRVHHTLDHVGWGESFLDWNNSIADVLPHSFVSDWMIVAEKTSA